MLVNLKEVLDQASKEKVAIAAFNVPNLEMVRAAVQAAEALNVPVILQHAEGHGSLISLEEIGPIMLAYAKRSKVPVVVHLDHGKTFEAIIKAITLGFTSVMIDASDLSFEDNIALTQEVVKIAHNVGVSVEAELGHVLTSSLGGGEGREPDDDLVGVKGNIYTDPQMAKQFVDRTAVDCLAVAFGTVHGIYLKEPRLDLDLIRKIHEEIQIPLVMHGGSGLTEQDYALAIGNGIAKINYYTYANRTGAEAIEKAANAGAVPVLFLEDYVTAVTQALTKEYQSVLEIFGRKNWNI